MARAVSTVEEVFRRARRTAIPLTQLRVSAWAESYRYLAQERADQSGRWRNEVTPYLVEIMDTIGLPGVTELVLVASAQVGKSECLNNILGYFVHIEPSPILFVCENQDKAEAWSKESLTPTIRETPVLSALFGSPRQRDSGNTLEAKSFPGGQLAIAWATSPATLSSRPRRVVLMDERDAFLTTKEGDPVKLAEKRTVTFRDRKVIVKVSTPRNRLELEPGAAPDAQRYTPIEWEYENSDKRKFFVPCPHCGTYQVLEWARVKWDSEEEALSAYYICVEGCVIEHEHKQGMLARGEWRAEKPLRGRAGFHIWEGYSPFVTWGEMAQNFLEAKKSKETLKVFVNTSLAEGWEENNQQASVEDLESRREPYGELLPDGVLCLTAGVDVQADRLECEITGWGIDDESWSIDYQKLYGDPSQAEVWQQLKELLTREYEFEIPIAGSDDASHVQTMRVAAVCIDSGGHHTDEVYRFCRKHAGRRWYAVKGANVSGKPLISPPTLQGRPPIKLYTVGTETAKDTLSAHLLVNEPGPGFCHFPNEFERGGEIFYGEKYFKQLRSEHVVNRKSRGAQVRAWEKIKSSMRNEALDVRVYTMAAKAILNPDLKRLMKRREIAAAAQPSAVAAEIEAPEMQIEAEAEKAAPGPRPRPKRRGQRGFVNNWR